MTEDQRDEYQDVIEAHGIKPEFHVTDESSADWVLRKIAEARAGRKRVEAQLAAKMEEYRREEEYFINRYQHELEIFARAELNGQKTKTLKLAEGNLSFRKKPAQLVVSDPHAAINWARANAPDAVKATMRAENANVWEFMRVMLADRIEAGDVALSAPTLQKSVLNDLFKQGEIPDGCDVEPETETFIIK